MTSEITLTGGAGEYMESATVVSWAVAVGDRVKQGDVVVVVETAKAATEIEAERDGVLVAIMATEGAEVGIGSVLGRIGDEGEALQDAKAAEPVVAIAPAESARPVQGDKARDRVSISPLARRLARQAGLATAGIAGSGPGGRIKSRDIERALAEQRPARDQAEASRLPDAQLSGQKSAAAPIVLIHGFGANSASWNSVRAYLDPVTTTLAPELPGHGRAAAAGGRSFDQLVDAMLTGLQDAGVSEGHLVGHSLGGAVAAAVAAHPEFRARSLTLIAPAGLGPEIDGRFLDGFLNAASKESLTPWLERLVGDRASLPQGYAEAVLRERSRLDVVSPQKELAERLFPGATQAIRIADMIASLHMPVRVIWGTADRIIPVSHGRDLPGFVALHSLAGLGHMPHVEAPELVARLVLQTAWSAHRQGA